MTDLVWALFGVLFTALAVSSVALLRREVARGEPAFAVVQLAVVIGLCAGFAFQSMALAVATPK